jgi:diaminopimelate decarboxylase
MGYPHATLIGVEYSNRCSGIHWHDFDDIWLQRPWEELNLKSHAKDIVRVLDNGALWISSIDLEIMWLASIMPDGHPNLLTPPDRALREVSKPYIQAHRGLPLEIPTFVTTDLSDWDLHRFCRENDWKVWLKGPYYEAVRTPDWSTLQHFRHVLSTAWATETLALQAHVSGYEESVMFSAYRGELLEAVRMQKRDLTELGKTWAGDVTDVPDEIIHPLKKVIADLNWTGGAELEMVRDSDDKLWLLEWNPRFPAWVHGSTITGNNLPATLVEGATGVPAVGTEPQATEFTRVVVEIPVKREYPLSPLPEPLGGAIGHSMKHPSGLLQFAQKLHGPGTIEPISWEKNGHDSRAKGPVDGNDIPRTFIDDLNNVDFAGLPTPASIFLPRTAERYFRNAADVAERISTSDLKVHNAYSIKTNPDERLLRLALENGFLAEAISLAEADKAVSVGFDPGDTVLNGPAKWWRKDQFRNREFKAIFCDSIEEFEQVSREIADGAINSEFLGIRIRTPNIPSRFGVPIHEPQLFRKAVEAIRVMPRSSRLAMHFHMASSNVGIKRWKHLFDSLLRWCSAITALSGRLIECVDIGGGWFPDDLTMKNGSLVDEMGAALRDRMSSVRELINEPGKALAQPSMALAAQILEIRRRKGDVMEAVIDGSIAELPMYAFQPHRVLLRDRNDGSWTPLRYGKSVLYGRLCMEHDIVAGSIDLPTSTDEGDILVFCDAGAYDRSMSYVFGVG